MNLPDDKQLVRENNISKMGLHAKLAWIALFFCLGLIALAHCVPIEVIYTGEGCDCPSKLDYTVNVPSVPKSKKCPYTPSEYGYKVDVPISRPAKAKVTYSFDFTVEEPRTPKPAKPSTLNLFAKVDRVAVKKGDCEDSDTAPSAPSTCRCGQCGITKPLYRYVFDNMPSQPPCKCRRPNCKCNRGRAASTPYSSNAILRGSSLSDMTPMAMNLETGSGGDEDNGYVKDGSGGAEVGAVNIRRKRDLQRTLFRPRKMTRERPGRFVKLYHKNLSDTPRRLFDFDGLSNKQLDQQQTAKKTKRKAKRTHYKRQRSRLVKRDIKGEYELLEKERDQMDLTLPEIIQFMPETLQPNFKRGQCYFGCGSKRPINPPKSTNSKTDNPGSSSDPSSTEFTVSSKEVNENTAATITYTDTNSSNDEIFDMNTDRTADEDANADKGTDNNQFTQTEKMTINEENSDKETHKDSATQNDIGSSHTKRQAANYYSGGSASSAESANPSCSKCLPALLTKRAYRANLPPAPPFSTNPNYKPQQPTYSQKSAYSAAQPTTENAPTSPYFDDRMGRKYLEWNDYMRDVTSALSVPDPLDHHAIPLRYDGDLESPTPAYSSSYPQDTPPNAAAQNYPVQHITNEQIDKIIADIVYRHPAFIDASSHFGGALVDPEPWQELETVAFLKKLIDGRLSLWFGKEDEHKYGLPPQLHNLQPPLYY
ncbi:uncharacterized protein LOC118753033 [Rhagoletis pomonella]|uniref:uncharacterized protein LOC118753033 n=1 Tax=Rhagoletis pomonella TaxID=28610 RepID=UPI00177DDAFE|nr:uncharacterized protein LOC118753033 [Rhagoletis pomonella]